MLRNRGGEETESNYSERAAMIHIRRLSPQWTWTLGCGNLDIGAFGAQGAVVNFSPTSK